MNLRMIKRVFGIAWLVSTLTGGSAQAQESGSTEPMFHLGVGFGELPWQGSFKLSFTAGVWLNDLVYVGAMYQIPDQIRRDRSSFNANDGELDGIVGSSEEVGQRFSLHARIRPHRLAPFVSAGLVHNSRDTEETTYDARERTIGAGTYDGALEITRSRPPGWAFGVGLGYDYRFDNGFNLTVEWLGALYARAPTPDIEIRSDTAIDEDDVRHLQHAIEDDFERSVFNTYHLFHIGGGYTF